MYKHVYTTYIACNGLMFSFPTWMQQQFVPIPVLNTFKLKDATGFWCLCLILYFPSAMARIEILSKIFLCVFSLRRKSFCVFNNAVACRDISGVMLFQCGSGRGYQELLGGWGEPQTEQERASKGRRSWGRALSTGQSGKKAVQAGQVLWVVAQKCVWKY